MPIPADTRIVFLDLDRTLLDDRFRQSSLEGVIASVARRLGFDPEEAGRQFRDSWQSSVTPETFQAWLRGSLGGRDPLR